VNSNVIITGLFFVFVFLFGFWLSYSGKPYNSFIFNFHKLIGLAMGIYLTLTVYRAHQTAPFNPLIFLVITITVIIFFILVAAGGLQSIEAAGGLENINQSVSAAISVIHKVFPYLALFSVAVTLYLLLIRNV